MEIDLINIDELQQLPSEVLLRIAKFVKRNPTYKRGKMKYRNDYPLNWNDAIERRPKLTAKYASYLGRRDILDRSIEKLSPQEVHSLFHESINLRWKETEYIMSRTIVNTYDITLLIYIDQNIFEKGLKLISLDKRKNVFNEIYHKILLDEYSIMPPKENIITLFKILGWDARIALCFYIRGVDEIILLNCLSLYQL